MGSIPFKPQEGIDKAVTWAKRAAQEGTQLLVFPEAFIGGYPKGMHYGLVVGAREKQGREEFQAYFDGAIEIPGPELDPLVQVCHEKKLYCVLGVIEKELGTCYCTAIFLGPEGFLGKHRKVMPTAMERMIWGYGDGSTLTTLNTPLGTIGSVICWENYMPMLRMAMYAKGVQLYCAPTVDDREVWQASMRHIALEGRCFVLSACQFSQKSDFPEGTRIHFGDPQSNTLIRGGSVIIGPLGNIIAGPVYDREELLLAQLDLDEIAQAKFDFDPVGHYGRPDIFQLKINETQQRPVSSMEEPELD